MHTRVVIVNRGTKANSTTPPETFYREPAVLAATADQDPPRFAMADDFARKVLEDEGS